MLRNPSFWIWGLIVTQFLSAFAHSLSFFVKQTPRNETEKQLIELTTKYKSDLGGGIKRTFWELFIGVSVCYTVVYTLGAVLNWYFLKTGISPGVWEGLLLIECIAYGILFLLMIKFTFWPPIIVTGLVFIFALGAYLSVT